MPIVVCAPDKFRGALTAQDAAEAMACGAAAAGWTAAMHPVADGGEGTREVIRATGSARELSTPSVDALGREADAPFLMGADGTATIVAADVIPLASVPTGQRDPLRASSRGLAAPILAAVAAGARRVVVFLGGTANMDGGLGLLSALGADVRDAAGIQLEGSGADLARIATLGLAGARERLRGAELVAATDVASPLDGPDGAARTFGPQKGASADDVRVLDAGLTRLAVLLGPVATEAGAGAAGGLGAALLALGATRVSGVQAVLDATRFADRLADADLVLTGEGRVDASTLAGKAVAGVVAASAAAGVPSVVLGGTVTPDADALYRIGASAVLAIGHAPRTLDAALASAAEDVERAARAACALFGAARSTSATA